MIRPFSALLLASSAIIPFQAHAQSLPSGGSVAAGSAEIGNASGGALSIHQTSDAAVINWQAFGVEQGNRVDILQPSSTAILLNRVTGGTTTRIAGQLNANGRVFVVNPNGILITATGAVKAAGFVGSTLDISDADFMAGHYDFAGSGGTVANAGRIEIARGGYAALVGGRVSNSGLILAPLGKVAMGAGSRATLDFSSDGFLKVAIGADQSAELDMPGRIAANGGSVILSAAQARAAARSTVNLSGIVEARGVESRGGDVVLTGGDIALTGATIDVSGKSGGGSVRIGGDRQGRGSMAHADTLRVDAATGIRADATGSGAGGDVVLWSDTATEFAGTISARGIGAKGGEAEVSSKGLLGFAGTADLRGSQFGTLLLDPYNLTISTAPSSGMAGFTANANNSVLNASVLTAALATANVTVTTGSSGSQAGNITVAAPLSWSSGATLRLEASNDISLNSAITARGGALELAATGNISQTGAIVVGRFLQDKGSFRTVAATLPQFEAGGFDLNGGSFVRALGGNGTLASPWLLSDIYGVQGMTTLRASNFALANDIDASATANWNGGAGFRSIGGESGSIALSSFTGTLDGHGYTIRNLYMNQPFYPTAGMFTILYGATVRNLRLSGVTVINNFVSNGGATSVGGLAGFIQDSTVDNVHIEATLRAPMQYGEAGGLAARIGGNSVISNISIAGSISATNVAGGVTTALRDNATISQAYVTAAVTSARAFGITYVSEPGTSIRNAWVSGILTGSTRAGIVAFNGGAVGADVFWDVETTGTPDGVNTNSGSFAAVGLTTAQARSQAAYAGFDFTNIWFQAAGMRPILRSEAAPAGGDGYIPVMTLNQLQLMSANLGANYRLANDIDATATNGADAAGIWGLGGWVPIGLGSAFSGNFDGGFHAIGNLTINRAATDYVGLFSRQMASSAVAIRNLRLVNANITGKNNTGAIVGSADWNLTYLWATGTVTANDSTGGIVGAAQGGTLTNLYFDGSVRGRNAVGGITGLLSSNGSRMGATGSVFGAVSVGGIAGTISGNKTASESFSTASVTATTGNAGGFVGLLSGATILKVWASGAVTTPSSGGGLVGNSVNGVLSNSYWDMESTGRTNYLGSGGVGGTANLTGLTTAQARSPGSYGNFGSFAATWYQGSDMRPILRSEALPESGGTVGVFNARQLQLINANLPGNFTLLGDIDLGATNSTTASAGIWGASGWTPLGTDGAGNVWGGSDFRAIGSITSGIYGFTGTLNGGGYSLTNLRINRPTIKNVGLFGVSAGTINDVRVTGMVTGASGVGGLAGMQKSGTISGSTSAVTVIGNTIVGGLVGNQVSTSTITRSSATGTVTGTDDAGGLVGYAAGIIDRSFASGAVSGTHYVGGLVGYLYRGSITNSYATGSANASINTAGGLLGKQDGGAVINSYSIGAVSAPTLAGGLIGQIISGGTVTSSYWDTATSGQATSAGGTGRTTAQMQDAATYAGWDFASTWTIAANAYPTLR